MPFNLPSFPCDWLCLSSRHSHLIFFFLSRLEWCELVEREAAFCLSSHSRERWSRARVTASFHTWLEPGQAANAFLGLSGYLLETDEHCSAVRALEAGRRNSSKRHMCQETERDVVPGKWKATRAWRTLLHATEWDVDLIRARWRWTCPL